MTERTTKTAPVPISGLAHIGGIFVHDPDRNVIELHRRG